jgi:hypothetical protein
MGLVRQRPFNSDFQVEVFEKTIAVRFWPTGSLYTFARFTTEREERTCEQLGRSGYLS